MTSDSRLLDEPVDAAGLEPRAGTLASLGRMALLLAAAIPLLAFVLTGLSRRLNFDESLALRSGWLLLEGIPAAPPFAMPTTIFIGWLGHWVTDPGLLFPLLRLLVLASVLACGSWMALRARLDWPVAALAVSLALLHAGFGVYAYEFRYDWALLVGWMLAFALLQGRRVADFAGLGVVVGWLLVHHVKGAFFGLALYAISALALWWATSGTEGEGPPRRTLVVALHAGLFGLLGLWLAVCVALGITADFVAVYTDFFALAVDQKRVFFWSALGPWLLRDVVWWALALAGLVWGARRLLAGPQAWRRPENRAVLFALCLSAPPLLFLLIHPKPWPYMLALPVPVLSILVARGLVDWFDGASMRRAAMTCGGVAAALLGVHLATGAWPGLQFVVASHTPSVHQIESLRRLQAAARPDERIVDPSGLAWFQPPCTADWYVDALFHERVRRGQWMRSLAHSTPGACPWVLRTYRLDMLPVPWQASAAHGYRDVGGGLLLYAGDARQRELADDTALSHRELRSFWW